MARKPKNAWVERCQKARRFPTNTCPASRHAQLIAEALIEGRPYPMLTEEPQNCGESIIVTVAALYEARTRIAELEAAAAEAAAIPLPMRWLTAAEVGALLGYSERQVQNRIACRPDFPKALRLDGIGHPRWKASEVAQWAERERGRSDPGAKRRKAA
jgi:predicted DNA-binding transcriptional regulator AlpA